MTNERAIYLLKSILPKKVSFAQTICASNCYGDEMVYEGPEPYAIEYAINSIQENDKLKAEIERVKNESHRRSDMFLQEIEQLKSELEQSAKLPCKVGDKLFSTENGYIEEFKVRSLSHIVNLVEFSRFNETVFFTREEAEQSLKGQVEE